VAKFRHLGAMVTNKFSINEEVNRKLNSRNAYYHAVHSLSSSRLLYRVFTKGLFEGDLYTQL
jgi:hypothetical protein